MLTDSTSPGPLAAEPGNYGSSRCLRPRPMPTHWDDYLAWLQVPCDCRRCRQD